jgi:hypothetical protein
MARSTWFPTRLSTLFSTRLWVAAAAICAALAGWSMVQARELRAELAAARAREAGLLEAARAAEGRGDPGPGRPRRGGLQGLARALATAPPAEPAATAPPGGEPERERSAESRGERRARRGAEFAAMFGRQDGETEAEYRERVMPMITGMLERPRERALELRREAEAKAGITAEQSAKIDEALAATYGELIEYTDAAVSEGQLSPYQRNVSGWLGYAGGLGGILNGTEGKIGSILKPEQLRAMYDAGFEWGEFVGVSAPWEKLRAPPPPRADAP